MWDYTCRAPRYEYRILEELPCGAETTFYVTTNLDDVRRCLHEYKDRYKLNVYKVDFDDNWNVASKTQMFKRRCV